MRDLSQEGSVPSLFDAPPDPSYMHAKEFVRWCCSFGTEFRNSPDMTNLRYWAQKNNVQINAGSEREILDTARPLFLKKIDQHVKKAEQQDAPN